MTKEKDEPEVEFLRGVDGSLTLYASPSTGDDLLPEWHPDLGWIRGIVHTHPQKYWFALPANKRMTEELPEDVWMLKARSMARSHFENHNDPT